MMQKDVLDRLRYASEGAGIDFKRAQYQLLSKDEDKKSELLKDILAMANTWRQGEGPAYILLGFQDCSPSPAEVVGLDSHLDDAQIQQFIGSKVKPKLEFTYEELEYEGKPVGVLTIPKQKRPFFVEKTYGRVHSSVVYVRRGSSTGEADPFEIWRMRDEDIGRTASTSVSLNLLDANCQPLQESYREKRVAWNFGDRTELPLMKRSSGAFSQFPINSEYWRELARYIEQRDGAVSLRIELHNASPFALIHLKLEITASMEGGAVPFIQEFDLEERPSEMFVFPVGHSLFEQQRRTALRKELALEVVGGQKTAVWRLDKLLPGESLTSPSALVFFPRKSGSLRVHARFLAADQPPVTFESSLSVEVVEIVADFEHLRSLCSQLQPED